MNRGICKGCGKPIVWIRTSSGKSMPCDAQKLANVPADDGSGNFWGLKTESSEWIVWSWGYYEHPVITHWMHLPEPPAKEDQK